MHENWRAKEKIDFQICMKDVEELSLREAEKYVRLMYFGHVEKKHERKKRIKLYLRVTTNVAVSWYRNLTGMALEYRSVWKY